MKNIIITVFTLASFAAQAQGDAISKFFSKYQNDDTFSQVTVSSKMFSLFTNMEMESQEDQEILNAISKLKGLRILAKENARNSRELYKEAMGMIPTKDYEELMSVRDKDQDFKFFIKELSPGKISELVMVMGGNEEFMVMSLFGEIDLKQVSKLGRKMDIEGLQQLEKMKDKKN
ncbi:MAG: DUF4252 domain-containing protein [Cyclobacteriaceae bacterium]|jgi:hypothetical protein|nr:DUF4252 domain-containing protein [Cyclobacteriaceae bacterium]